jgi:type III secretion protein T
LEPYQDSFISYALNYSVPTVWHTFLLALARIVPPISVAPFLGGKMVPNTVKMGLGAVITLIFLPQILATTTGPVVQDAHFMLLIFKEALIGSLFGMIITVPFYYCEGAGSLVDHQRGAQSLQVMNPGTSNQTSPIGTLYNNVMLIYFLTLGGPIIFFDAILTSFVVLPPTQFISFDFFSLDNELWQLIIGICPLIVKMVFLISAPSLLSMLLSDLFLGIANRMAPQVQISFLLWSMKAFVGIGMVFLAWGIILKKFKILAIDWLDMFSKLVETL